MTTHFHIATWAVAIILLIVALRLYRNGNQKGGKIVHMILRLDYLLILYTGGTLLTVYLKDSSGAMFGEAIVKGLAGIWVIIATELILVKTSKGKSAKGAWIQFAIALIITLALGFGRLPYGIQWFK